MSYFLDKNNENGELMEKWVPYKPMEFEKGDMPLRQEQLSIRTRECKQTLDFLIKLNDGAKVENIIQSTMNLEIFKVNSKKNKVTKFVSIYQIDSM